MAVDDALLRLADVRFSYDGARRVLDGLDLAIRAGERVALLGANGSGKTTLLHLIVGLLRPEAGRIEAFGRERCVEADFHEVRRRAGLVFQDPEDQLFCPTVLEDVAFGPVNLGHPRAEAVEIAEQTLAELGLDGYAERITYRLSGGEKRLVSLAAVLAMRPDVLLLDEPTANLDARARRRLLDVLGSRREAMLLVDHDREIVSELATRACVLAGGRIVADRPAGELLADEALLAAHGLHRGGGRG